MSDTGVTVALVGTIIVLTRVIEGLWKRYNIKNGNGHKISLDTEQQRQLRDVHERFLLVEKDVKDLKSGNDRIAEAMQKVAECMKKISETNVRVVELVEKIDRRQEIEDEVNRRDRTRSTIG